MLLILMTMTIHLFPSQDGPVQTAPPAVEEAIPASTPGTQPAARGRISGWDQISRGPPLLRSEPPEHCSDPSLRRPDQSGFDCPVPSGRQAQPDRAEATSPGAGVPTWALTDPARWETSQCGSAGDDACRRQARNRLAMARAGQAVEVPAVSQETTPAPQNCRMVFRRAQEGVGGSMTRVCGDGADAEAALDRLESVLPARPAAESCERPGSLETPEAWVARCRTLPPR